MKRICMFLAAVLLSGAALATVSTYFPGVRSYCQDASGTWNFVDCGGSNGESTCKIVIVQAADGSLTGTISGGDNCTSSGTMTATKTGAVTGTWDSRYSNYTGTTYGMVWTGTYSVTAAAPCSSVTNKFFQFVIPQTNPTAYGCSQAFFSNYTTNDYPTGEGWVLAQLNTSGTGYACNVPTEAAPPTPTVTETVQPPCEPWHAAMNGLVCPLVHFAPTLTGGPTSHATTNGFDWAGRSITTTYTTPVTDCNATAAVQNSIYETGGYYVEFTQDAQNYVGNYTPTFDDFLGFIWQDPINIARVPAGFSSCQVTWTATDYIDCPDFSQPPGYPAISTAITNGANSNKITINTTQMVVDRNGVSAAFQVGMSHTQAVCMEGTGQFGYGIMERVQACLGF